MSTFLGNINQVGGEIDASKVVLTTTTTGSTILSATYTGSGTGTQILSNYVGSNVNNVFLFRGQNSGADVCGMAASGYVYGTSLSILGTTTSMIASYYTGTPGSNLAWDGGYVSGSPVQTSTISANGNAAFAGTVTAGRFGVDWTNQLAAGSETIITTTATLTRQTAHACSAATSDYTVTLPTAASCTGSFIGVRIGLTSTKLVTLAPAGSETIDNVAGGRVMWAGEYAVVYSDGSNWKKVWGVSRPMQAKVQATGNQTLTHNTTTFLTLGSAAIDTGGMADPTNSRVNIRRAGNYRIEGLGGVASIGASNVVICGSFLTRSAVGSNLVRFGRQSNMLAGEYPLISGGGYASLLAADQVQAYVYYTDSTDRTTEYGPPDTIYNLVVTEQNPW